MIHEIKASSEYFNAIQDGAESIEVKKNGYDCDIHLGDFLALNEYEGSNYTGRCLMTRITSILEKASEPGKITFGIIGCKITTNCNYFIDDDDYCKEGSIPVYGGAR
jgi:hypothetical protein